MHSLVKTSIASYVDTVSTVQHHGFADTFVNIVPTNIFTSLGNGDMLSIMFGLEIGAIGEKGKPVLRFFEGVAQAMFWVFF